MPKAAIQIAAISKKFGAKEALRGVSLTVQTGQVFGFLGPNGAGKTTTLRCLLDYIRPDTGTAHIFGLDSQKLSVESKKMIGYMSADNHLYLNWNANQHLSFAKSIWGQLPLAEQLLKRLQLQANVPVKHLSTGNQQKLGLVLAMAHSPKLVILDEPTRGLDPLLQQEIIAILKEYQSSGGTVFISSHNLAEVEQVCDTVGIIKDGQMVANKSMADIRTMKAHLLTVSFKQAQDVTLLKGHNIQILKSNDRQVVAKVQGDITPVLHQLSKSHIVDLEITHLPLEEVFMAYYRPEEKI